MEKDAVQMNNTETEEQVIFYRSLWYNPNQMPHMQDEEKDEVDPTARKEVDEVL
jgi:hypothetical protein